MRDVSTGTILSGFVCYTGQLRSDDFFILSSVMQLCNKYFNTNILKLNCRMSESSISPWPKNFMLIGQAIFHSISLNNQNYPLNRCYTGTNVSLENRVE